MKLELVVKLKLKATHTLEENETPHEHEWRVDVTLAGPAKNGRVISLPLAQNLFNQTLNEIRGTHLNAFMQIPTCENLAVYFMERFNISLRGVDPDLRITCIEVGVNEDDGSEMGAARLSP
jgi:6-pyruvoyl-tetrahydropterin synthase